MLSVEGSLFWRAAGLSPRGRPRRLKPAARWARWSGRFAPALGGILLLAGVAGCPGVVGTPGVPNDVVDGNRDASAASSTGKISGEPNGSFLEAIVAVFDEDRVARLQGTVSGMGDLDVYLLGALSPGDRVIVDVASDDSLLDASVAIFDTAQRLVINNDDRGGSTSRFLDPHIDWIVRHGGSAYYLVVTHAAFAARGRFTGVYTVDVRLTSEAVVPAPVGQVVVLDFDGAALDSPVLGSMLLDPFDAARISPIYEGRTETIIQQIRSTVEQNYERFDVTVLTSDDPAPPEGVVFSTIYFGGFNRDAFGISESVDLNNADFCDDAIIYAESFTPSVFSLRPTAAQLGVAIGNVAAHEVGHLLGLNHTDDDRDLMDARSAADAFLEDQEFMEAPLSSDIMPIGTQDGVLLLQETVGLNENGSL